MSGFKHLEHASEAYVEAYGKNLEEAFENAGRALFDVMTDVSKVEPKEGVDIEVVGEDKEALLFEWLSRLLIEFDTSGTLYSRFKVYSIEATEEGYRLRAKAWGEPLDLEKHPPKVEVKAVTYARMGIEEGPRRTRLRFVLDI